MRLKPCKIFCFLGYHKWRASLSDYLEEFGALGLSRPANIASTSVCSCCGAKYKDES